MGFYTVLMLLALSECSLNWVSGLQNGYLPDSIKHKYCRNAVKGYSMIPWDCTGYIHCGQTSGLASWVNCPSGLLFDMQSLTCEWFSSSCTREALGKVAATYCPTQPDLVFGHPSNCAMFYNCSKPQASPEIDLLQYEDECYSPLQYDAEAKKCAKWPKMNINYCNKIPVSPCEYRRGCKPKPAGPCAGLSDGRHPAPNTAFNPSFIICSKGTLLGKFTCNPQGYVFDPVRRTCTKEYRYSVMMYCKMNPKAMFPDPLNCAKYYDCSKKYHALGLQAYQAECEYMYLFDSSKLTCVKYDNLSIPCGDRFEPKAPCEYDVTDCSKKGYCIPCSASCKSLPNGYVPYPGLPYTRFYLHCENERTLDQLQCLPPKVFLPDIRSCGVPGLTASETRTTTTSFQSTTYAATSLDPTSTAALTTTPVATSTTSSLTSITAAATTSHPTTTIELTTTPVATSTTSSLTSTTAETTTPHPTTTIELTTTPVATSTTSSVTSTTAETTTSHPTTTIELTTTDVTTSSASSLTSTTDAATTPHPTTTIELTTTPVATSTTSSLTSTTAETTTSHPTTTIELTMTPVVTSTLSPLTSTTAAATTSHLTTTVKLTTTPVATSTTSSLTSTTAEATTSHPTTTIELTTTPVVTSTLSPLTSTTAAATTSHLTTTVKLTTTPVATSTTSSLTSTTAEATTSHPTTTIELTTTPVVTSTLSPLTSTTAAATTSHLTSTVDLSTTSVVTSAPSSMVSTTQTSTSTSSPPSERQQCACTDELQPMNATLEVLTANITSLYNQVNRMLPSPFDCVSPPNVQNSILKITYEDDYAVATYTCNQGYSLCGSTLKSKCKGDNSWFMDSLGKCVQDTWINMPAPAVIQLPCPPVGGSTISIRGRKTGDSFSIELAANDTVHLDVVVTPDTGAIDVHDGGTNPLASHTSPTVLKGELVWTIKLEESEFQFFVNGHMIDSIPHSAALKSLDKLTISAGFLSDQIKYSATGTNITSARLRPLVGNLALGKLATSSTSFQSVRPSRAADGDTNVQWGHNSCWAANIGDLDPWWQVDLGMEYYVSSLVVTSMDCSGSCGDRLHDFRIDIFKENPESKPDARKETCYLYNGVFPAGGYQTIYCDSPVTGRYLRVTSMKTTVASDQMTLCEVEVYGGVIQPSGWKPFTCPDPPLVPGAAVELSYTTNGANATYTCHGSDVMCPDSNVISCSSDVGWNSLPGSCLKTELDRTLGDTVSHVDMCPLKLGSVIEMWATPRESGDKSLLIRDMADIFFHLELDVQGIEKSVILSHNVSGNPSEILKTSFEPFMVDRESHIVLSLLTDHLLIEVDGQTLYKYPLLGTKLHKANVLSTTPGLDVRKIKIHDQLKYDVLKDPATNNLALKADVTSSSTTGSPPSFAVDGNPSNTQGRSSCWHAQTGDTDQWYQVDLGKHFFIRDFKLDIQNRCTGCENVALNKKAVGNNVDVTSSPSYAVDGILDGMNCFTSAAADTAFVIDLGRSYTISSVAIQRGPHKIQDSLSDIAITIYEDERSTIHSCTEKVGVLGEFDKLVCDRPVSGRFVRIARMSGVNKGSLTLCEVEVYAVAEDKLHDFSVYVYRDNPATNVDAAGSLCTRYVGEFPRSHAQTLQCIDGVWGRYVRIQADSVLGQNDRMTICEVEVYGDKVVKKEWSPFDCPSPPVHTNSLVTVSYSETEAVATYKCIDGFSTCSGLNTITCDKSNGWIDNAEKCVKTVFTTEDRQGLSTIKLACGLQLGQAIEFFVTPNETQSIISLLNSATQDTVMEMNLVFNDDLNVMELHTYPLAPTPSKVTVPDMPFTVDSESEVVLTFLSDHVDVAVDGKSVFAYPNILSPHMINTIISSAPVRKLSVLPVGNIKTKFYPIKRNLAKFRPTMASSDISQKSSSVVDGNTDPVFARGSCWAADSDDLDPWWQVDLGSFYYISHLYIVARGHCFGFGTCGNWLRDFLIEVFHRNPQPGDIGTVCAKYDGVFPSGSRETVKCIETVNGRFVRISPSDDNNLLALCEVEVFGGKVVKEASGPHDCKAPPHRPNTNVDLTTTTAGLVADYTCVHGYRICGEITRSHCVDGIWGDFKAQCFKNVWHYTTTGEPFAHELSCPLTVNSEIQVTATPTDNNGFSVELELPPQKKILVVDGSFADRTVTLAIKDGTKVVNSKKIKNFPFAISKEFRLEAKVLKYVTEVYVNGKKLGEVPVKLPIKGSPTLTTSHLATREVRYIQSNEPADILHFTDKETPWLHIPTDGVNNVLFEVKACEDVLVDLRESETSDKRVLFSIGGRQNTWSQCSSCSTDKLTKWHKSLNCNRYKEFWVSWATSGNVSIGSGHTVGVDPIIENVPADFKTYFLQVSTNETDGSWILPNSGGSQDQSTCPRPEPIPPLEIVKQTVIDRGVTTEYACSENYMFCGESSTSVCDNGTPTSTVKGTCERHRIPTGTGPLTSMDLPCVMGDRTSISAYITPTNSNGSVLVEISGATGKSLQLRIDMKNSSLSVDSVLENGNVSPTDVITGFPFKPNQESHLVIGYSTGKYTIYIDGKLMHTFTTLMPHDKMSTVSIHNDYSLRDFQATPQSISGALTCEAAKVQNSVVTGTDKSVGGEATLQCMENFRFCSSNNTVKCGGDGQWIVPPDQTCKQYRWTNLPTVAFVITKTPPCPLAAGMAIKMVATADHRFWFDLRSGNEAQLLVQYETMGKTMLRMTTAILDNVLFEKIIENPPIVLNQMFTLVIELHDKMYSIVVDGKLVYDFAYLSPVSRTQHLIITAGVTVKHFEFMDTIPPRGTT